MLKSLGTEFKVGLFAIVALVTLGYMFMVLSPETFENKEYKGYYTVLRNAAGIVAKSQVKTSGVTIGKVKAVTLEGNTTRVAFDIDKQVKIPTSARVEIKSIGLLGDKHLEIVRGTDDSGPFIDDGGFIPQSEDGGDMETMIARASDIMKDVKQVTATLAKVFGGEKGETSIRNIVTNLEQVSADLRETSTTVKNVVGSREEDLHKIINDVRATVADLRQFSGNLKDTLNQENRDRIDRILTSFDETMVDVKSSAKNVSLISDKIEKGEGTIGRLVTDDKAITELEGAIKDIRNVLAPAKRLTIDVDYHGELRFATKTTQHYFNILFKTRPDFFYKLGITDTTSDSKVTETSAPQTNADGTTVVREKTTEKMRIKFNAQIAKRWYNAGVRFGLFETSGGLAGDLWFFDDRVHATVEAFDWDTNSKVVRRNAHLKSYVSVLFYNHIYALAGVDDATRTDPKTGKVDKKVNYMFGGGLTFTDQDLKAVLGTAALAR